MEEVNPNLDADERLLRSRVAATIAAGGGVTSISKNTGIPKGTLEKYAAQSSTPSLLNAAKIAVAAKSSLDFMAFSGELSSEFGAKVRLREMVQRIADQSDQTWGEEALQNGWVVDADEHRMMRLPVFEVEAAAGYGAAVQGEVKLGEVAFDRQFLRDRGASPETCTVIRAKGDSMSPTIPDGSLLIVDHSQQDIAHGYITVIGIGNDLLVKRIRRRLDGTVELISDNQAYAPEVIGSDRLEHLRVVGRVVYFCRVP